MDAVKFERLLRHLCDTYRSDWGKPARHFDDATCHSRRIDHWVSIIEVSEGRLAKRGWSRRVGGRGASNYAGWLTGYAGKLGWGVPKERFRLAMRSITVDFHGDAIWGICDRQPNTLPRTESKGGVAKVSGRRADDSFAVEVCSRVYSAEFGYREALGYSAAVQATVQRDLASMRYVEEFYRCASAADAG